MEENFWKLGDKVRLARAANMTRQQLHAYLKGTKNPRFRTAVRLSQASLEALGKRRQIPAVAWMIPGHPHRAFQDQA